MVRRGFFWLMAGLLIGEGGGGSVFSGRSALLVLSSYCETLPALS
jgi:hypothetical protein